MKTDTKEQKEKKQAQKKPDYSNIKTGQDMIDAEIKPKNSSAHLALITYLRLQALRNNILEGINEEITGKWIDALEYGDITTYREITDSNEVRKQAKTGVRVRGKGSQDGRILDGLEGIIKVISDVNSLGIEWDSKYTIPGGNDLSGFCRAGQGLWVNPKNLTLLATQKQDGYKLAEDVVADPNLGHYARFREEWKGTGDYRGRKTEVTIPAGTIGTLTGYDESTQIISFTAENPLPEINEKKISFPADKIKGILQASSLGQTLPLDLEEEVEKQAMLSFFPKTVLKQEVAKSILTGLLMGKDMIFYGPPGSGKSSLAKDIVEVGMQQKHIFIVQYPDGDICKAQCSPYSLFDENFGKEVIPCPECKIKYGKGNFRETGKFIRPTPEEVNVVVAVYSDGRGIEKLDGKLSIQSMNFAGYKIPRLNGTEAGAEAKKTETDYDPEGFQPGALVRTNNGILIISEIDKIRPQVLDNLLEALEEEQVKPEQLRHQYPSHNMMLGTANDATVFPTTINDRMLLFRIDYPEDVDTAHDIIKRACHGGIIPVIKTHVEDTYLLPEIKQWDIPMPEMLERAVSSFYVHFRNEYRGKGKNEVSGSGRSEIDALGSARAMLLLDQAFYEKTPQIATDKYAEDGIRYALFSRIQENQKEECEYCYTELNQWIKKEFPLHVEHESKVWWARANQRKANAAKIIPEIEGAYYFEIKQYQLDPENAFEPYKKLSSLFEDKDKWSDAKEKAKYPLMSYLLETHPTFDKLDKEQLTQTIKYLMEHYYPETKVDPPQYTKYAEQ